MIGIPVGAALAAVAGWRWSFGALGLGSAVAVVLLARQVSDAGRGRSDTSWWGSFAVVADIRVGTALALTLVTQLFSLGAYAYVGAVLHSEFGWNATLLGVIGVLVGLGSVAGSLINGRLVADDRGGVKRRLGWVLLMGAAVVAFATVAQPVVAVLALGAWFVGSGVFVTEQQTLLATTAGGRRAAASAWNTSAMHAGTALGVTVIGFASVLTAGMWTTAIIGALLAIVLTLVSAQLQRRRARCAFRRPSASADLSGRVVERRTEFRRSLR